MAYVLSFWVTGNEGSLAPGWSSLMFVLLVVGGSLMILLGFVGTYIGFIFQEVKRRPIYITRSETRSQPTKPEANYSSSAGGEQSSPGDRSTKVEG